MRAYRAERNYENLQKMLVKGVGEYGIPQLRPTPVCEVENWISFNYAKGCEEPDQHGIHFFIDDYQFMRLWTNPDAYLGMLRKFQAVCTPDFSPYADFPKAIQLYNHYRKHWLGAYWQAYGVKIIPTVTWSSPATLEWCFDGEPENSVIALSSVGMFQTAEYKEWFLTGYTEMKRRLHPTKIIWKGRIPDEVSADREIIYQIPSFTDKWRDEEII